MDLFFNSDEKKDKDKEKDTSVKIANIILPILVYIPITIFVVLMGGFFGVKIYKYISKNGGISTFIEENIQKIFEIKPSINKFIIKTVNTFWPDKETIMESEKTYKHVRLDSALVLTGSLFILTMIILYNYDYIKSMMFSKVNAGIRAAKNKIQKGTFIIKNKGATISVGKPGKSMGEIKKIYLYDEKEELWYLNQAKLNTNGVDNDYKKVKSGEEIQKDIQYYYLYDVEVNGQIIKKFNHLQLKGKFLDPNINNGIPNLKGAQLEKNPRQISGIKRGAKVNISTRKNIYDHNIFNVYDTNTSVDFLSKSMQFIDKDSDDSEKKIDNWEAHLVIPKKSGVLLKKWGRKGYKKGIYSLATNGEHSGFTLGIKGNGVDTDDPLNNYIFKDVNGKTYQAELADYGVEQFGPNNYVPGFKIVYRIRVNKQNTYDVTIFINDQFVMNIKDGGVPLNEIKWCGDIKTNKGYSSIKFDPNKDEKSKVGQYYVKNDIRCDLVNGEIKRIINDEAYCIPKECNSNEYYDLFTSNCKQCPNGTEIEKNPIRPNDPYPYPLKENCKIIDEQSEVIGTLRWRMYISNNKQNAQQIERKMVNKGFKKIGDIVTLEIKKNSKEFGMWCDEQLDFEYGGKFTINTKTLGSELIAQEYDENNKLKSITPDGRMGLFVAYEEKLFESSRKVTTLIVDGKDQNGNMKYKEKEVLLPELTKDDFLLLKDSYSGSEVDSDGNKYVGLGEILNQIRQNSNVVDINGEFATLLDSMEETKQQLINSGGYPVNNNNKTKPKPSYMPTLIVYQTEIIDKRKGKERAFIRPMQKEETALYDKFFNSFAPLTWFNVKRNVSNKIPDTSTRGFSKRNSTLIGGVAFLFGFVIFTSLLVNQFSNEVKTAKAENLKDIFVNKTSYYTYSIIFIGLALLLFALLLFYAATSDSGSKFLSMLLIVVSAVVVLAALFVIFRDKIDKFVKNNPYIKFFYHALFVIPCLFIDLVNYLHYEFKSSPRIVFIIFAIEVAIILSLILIPAIRNRLYLYISNSKGKKKKINMKINNLKNQKIKLKAAIEQIKNFKPFRDPLIRMDLNTVNDVVTKKVKKNKDTGMYEDEITPQNTDVVGIVKKFITDKKDKIINIAKNINPLGELPTVSAGLNNASWEIIKKEQLDKKFNAMKLNKLLNSYGYKSVEECDNIMNKKKADKCKESLAIMLEHIQINSKNILLFNTVISEINDKIEKLEKIKKKSTGPLQKGTVALNKPVYFRKRKFIPIDNFNESQVEELKYNYSISCWFFVHSQSPNYNSNYHKETSIISYNGEPTIYYHGKNNELIIRSKKLLENANNDSNSRESLARIKVKELELEKIVDEIKKEKKESELNKLPNIEIKIDTDKILSLEKQKSDIESEILAIKSNLEDNKNEMMLIYKKSKFKLQKWHNLVINYVGGVIDVFLNGELVASINRVVSYKLFNRLMIGDWDSSGENGIGGGICNVVYYPTYISKSRIKSNYNYFKDKNPPTI